MAGYTVTMKITTSLTSDKSLDLRDLERGAVFVFRSDLIEFVEDAPICIKTQKGYVSLRNGMYVECNRGEVMPIYNYTFKCELP